MPGPRRHGNRRRPEPRRRPSHRPPQRHFNHHSHSATKPPAHGFTGPGWSQFYRVVLPLRGREKRLFFNNISDWIVTSAGLGAALFGYAAAGWFGALIGLGLGLTGCASLMQENRYHRS